jgi:hypothetical protein
LLQYIYEKEFFMTQRQVDVMNKAGEVLYTYPITLGSDTSPKASDFEKAALSEATRAQLVPEGDIGHMTARMQPHVGAQSHAAGKPGTFVKN